jgi:hypothetical protein
MADTFPQLRLWASNSSMKEVGFSRQTYPSTTGLVQPKNGAYLYLVHLFVAIGRLPSRRLATLATLSLSLSLKPKPKPNLNQERI